MKNAIITGALLVSALAVLVFTRTLFIPALLFSAAALFFAVRKGVLLVRSKDSKRVVEARALVPFAAALLFLTLVTAAGIAIVGGLGHGGRASMTVPLKQLAVFLGIFVMPVSLVLFLRYYRTVPPGRRGAALLCGGGLALVLAGALLLLFTQIAGWPPILYAARTDSRGLEKRLIAMGVDVNVRDRYTGWDPLTYAAWSGDREMAELLLAAGARVHHSENNDWPALVHAAMQGHTDIVRLLLTRVDRPEGKNAALCFASRHGHAATAVLLLDAGADMRAKGRLGRTAIEEACDAGQPGVLRLLLARSQVPVPVLASCGNALLSAAQEGDLASLKLLLDKGVEVNYQGYAKWTALMSAARTGSTEAVTYLLDHGADPNIVDAQGKTALRMAREAGHDDIRDLLLRHGAAE